MHETGDTCKPIGVQRLGKLTSRLVNSTSTPIRSGGKGYIDEQPGAELASSLEQKEENDTLSGSSVEEDGDTDVDQPSEWSGGEGNDVDRLADAIRADLSFPEVTVDDRDYIEQSWDVEDEDWELAHGGALSSNHFFLIRFRFYQTIQPPSSAACCCTIAFQTFFFWLQHQDLCQHGI